MDQARFWSIIDTNRSRSEGDCDRHMEELAKELSTLKADEIGDFDRIFCEHHNDAYTWDLWAAADLIGGGCSDDSFMDFRGWLISRGQQAYDNAMADPESLLDILEDDDTDGQIEGYQYIPRQVWETKFGSDDDFPQHEIVYRQKPAGAKWDEKDLDDKYPKLSESLKLHLDYCLELHTLPHDK